MGTLTFQTNIRNKGWVDAAEITFLTKSDVQISYDLDYAVEFENSTGNMALSLDLPVSFQPYRGPIQGFFLDLIPQGDPLKRLLARHNIKKDGKFIELSRHDREVEMASLKDILG